MKIKYSPTLATPETQVKFIDDFTIEIDGERYEFSPELVEYPDVSEQTGGAIQHAEVRNVEESGHESLDQFGEIIYVIDIEEHKELYLTVLCRYQDKGTWENPNYYEGGGYRGSKYEDIG